MEAYETIYRDYSTGYPLDEPIEDHVDHSYFDKFRADFAAQQHITVEEVNDEEFQAFLNAAMWSAVTRLSISERIRCTQCTIIRLRTHYNRLKCSELEKEDRC